MALRDTAFQLQRVPGAAALPGAYTVRLTAGGGAQTRRFTLRQDPRVQATGADLQARFDLATRTQGMITEVIETVNGLATVRGAAAQRRGEAAANQALATTLRRFEDSLAVLSRTLATPRTTGFEGDPYATSSLSELGRFTYGDINAAPSQAERTGSVDAFARARRQVDAVRRATAALLPAVNEALRGAGRAAIELPGSLRTS